MEVSETSFCGIEFEIKKNGFSNVSYILIHGDEDIVLSPLCSQTIYDWAEEPKELILLSGASHSFKETEQELTEKVEQWIRNVL